MPYDTLKGFINKQQKYMKYFFLICKSLYPPGMRRRSDVSVRSQISREVADHAEMSSRRRSRYVNETDLFDTSCDVLLVRGKN